MMNKHERGDTIVEVIVAFAVFAMLAVGTTVIMNRSLSLGQRSLETTLVRQQVDSQAELLRYARDTKSPIWTTIKNNVAASPGESSYQTCPSTVPSPKAFVMTVNSATDSLTRVALDGSNFARANYYSKVDHNFIKPRAHGLWITPVRVSGSTEAYDMYIRACWDSVGIDRPVQVSTIVRLYEN